MDVQLDEVETEPVTLQEVKDFCRIDINTDDDLVEELITASREQCEAVTGVSFVSREVIAVIDNTNGNTYLPYGPVADLDEVAVEDEDGNEITDFKLIGTKFPYLKYPREIVTVTYDGGYADLPKDLKTALMNAVYWKYENRAEMPADLGDVAMNILKRYRRV